MRRKKVPPIALKAIVTTQNQAWNSLQLYRELKEEHEKNEIVPEITGLVKKSGIGTFSSCQPLPIIGSHQERKFQIPKECVVNEK